MKNNIKKILAVLSVTALICAGGCAGNSEAETTTAVPAETTATVTESTETVDYSKEVRTVEIPYTDGNIAIFGFNANDDILRSENIPRGDPDTYYTYTYTNESTVVKVSNIKDSEGDISYELFYDENGNLIRKDEYGLEGTEPEYTYIYEYNSDGNCTGEALIHNTAGAINNGYENTYEYDENGNCIKETFTDSYGNINVTVNTYNESGKLIRSDYEDKYGKVATVYEYDSNGNLAKSSNNDVICEYNADGSIAKETFDGMTTEYIYENGLLIKTVRDGQTLCEYAYFDNNNIVRRYWYESEDTVGEINIDLYSEVFAE